ncbi:peptide MFS transporter [uncultured Vagococcus sp.]|uniref:peptide MFS transporter n=1 Tax=uncultured Vagococcus sp. TaxID=189676 RepID=UPI0028D46E6D|nr:peptide MFS transporter [uncultured Vagococcus sp.]
MNETVEKTKFPIGFYFCSITFTFERAAYYASKWLIYAFLTTALVSGGLEIGKGEAAIMQSYLVAFTYAGPVLFGVIADRWIGARYLIPVGMFLMGGGYYLASIATSKSLIWAMIILVSIGTGLFKGNVSAITGELFSNQKELDSAYSVQYSFINIGSFIGTTAVGVLVATTFMKNGIEGFSQCFFLAAMLCIVGGIWFIFAWRFLGDAGKEPFAKGHDTDSAHVRSEKQPLTTIEKKRVFAIILVSFFSIIFWLFWYMSYLSVYDYMAEFVKLDIGKLVVPTSWFDSLNGLTCIILGPVLAALWLKLARRPQGDMSLFKKTGIGLALLGASFLMLVGAELSRGVGASSDHKASLIWIILFGLLLSLGEMFFSPLGNSFVSKYAPRKILSILMGVWTFATFIAGFSYGRLYAIVLQFDMMIVYTIIPIITFIAAILLFMFDKKLKTLIIEDDE